MIDVLIKRREKHGDRKDSRVKTEAETMVIQPQAQGHGSPQEARGGRKDPPHEPPEGAAL